MAVERTRVKETQNRRMTHDQEEWEATLKRVASTAAAEVVALAAAAAAGVSATAVQAASTLAETTRVDLQYIKDDLKEIKNRLDNKFVAVETFEPIQRLVYGLLALVLASVVGTLLTLVIRR